MQVRREGVCFRFSFSFSFIHTHERISNMGPTSLLFIDDQECTQTIPTWKEKFRKVTDLYELVRTIISMSNVTPLKPKVLLPVPLLADSHLHFIFFLFRLLLLIFIQFSQHFHFHLTIL